MFDLDLWVGGVVPYEISPNHEQPDAECDLGQNTTRRDNRNNMHIQFGVVSAGKGTEVDGTHSQNGRKQDVTSSKTYTKYTYMMYENRSEGERLTSHRCSGHGEMERAIRILH